MLRRPQQTNTLPEKAPDDTHRHVLQDRFPKMHPNSRGFVASQRIRLPRPASLNLSHCSGHRQGNAAVSSAGSGDKACGVEREALRPAWTRVSLVPEYRCPRPTQGAKRQGGERRVGHGPCVLGGEGIVRALRKPTLFVRKELLTVHHLWAKEPLWGEGRGHFSCCASFWRWYSFLYFQNFFLNRTPILLSLSYF